MSAFIEMAYAYCTYMQCTAHTNTIHNAKDLINNNSSLVTIT